VVTAPVERCEVEGDRLLSAVAIVKICDTLSDRWIRGFIYLGQSKPI